MVIVREPKKSYNLRLRRRRKPVRGTHSHSDERNTLASGIVRFLQEDNRAADLMMKAIVVPGDETQEGTLIEAVTVPWFELIKLMKRDQKVMHEIDWRTWEEMVAGAYERAGFDEVVLTPRSGDLNSSAE